jgi:hypothetical protein
MKAGNNEQVLDAEIPYTLTLGGRKIGFLAQEYTKDKGNRISRQELSAGLFETTQVTEDGTEA